MIKTPDKQWQLDGADELAVYLQQIRSYPLLTPEQEQALAEACAGGDKEAIRTMINSNLRRVVSIARQYVGRGVPLMDLIQEGSIGLVTAVKKFDHTKNIRFSTYATPWIRQGIDRCILNHAGLIRLPRQKMESLRKLLAAATAIRQEGAEVSDQELSRRTGIAAEQVQQLLDMLPQIVSLNYTPDDPEHDALQDLLKDLQAPQPYEELVRKELKHTMETLLSALDSRQQQILRLHFGMDDGISHSLDEIGKRLGISKERTRQIEQQALKKLQDMGADLGLEAFLQDD